jgi:hypothetical protein
LSGHSSHKRPASSSSRWRAMPPTRSSAWTSVVRWRSRWARYAKPFESLSLSGRSFQPTVQYSPSFRKTPCAGLRVQEAVTLGGAGIPVVYAVRAPQVDPGRVSESERHDEPCHRSRTRGSQRAALRPGKSRVTKESGRPGSNRRRPAWEAGIQRPVAICGAETARSHGLRRATFRHHSPLCPLPRTAPTSTVGDRATP